MKKRIIVAIMALLLVLTSMLVLTSCDSEQGDLSSGKSSESEQNEEQSGKGTEAASYGVRKDGTYDQKNEVALYIKTYKKLPKNYITKKEAKRLGWNGGSVEQVAPGKTIGGDRFGNYEKKLPKKNGRTYYECDIDTLGRKNRGPKRIIYSNDGLIYYTGDHYDTFHKMPQSA